MRLRSVNDLASIAADWCWRTDADLRLTSIEGRYTDLTGLETAVSLGGAWPGLAGDSDGDDEVQDALRVLRERRPFRDLVYTHRHPDGRMRWFRFGGAPVFTRTGTFRGFRGLCSEVTEERQAEEQRAERTRQLESSLIQQNRRFDTALAHMSHGLYMLDADLRITVLNRRFLELYGLSPDIVKVGTTAEELIRHSAEIGNFGSMTPEEAWTAASQRHAKRDVRQSEQTLADGRTIALTFAPKPNGGFIAVHEDVTARKLADARLAEEHRRLEIALSHMSHGLVLFDADHRVTVFNRQFLVLHDLPPGTVRTGMTAEELIRTRVAVGNFPGRAADDVWREVSRRIGSGSPYRLDQQLTDGRTIVVTYAPAPGGGFVTVHEDITARKRAEAHIAHMARHDALTGLPNRTVLHEGLADALRSETGTTAVLCLDLDRFKAVNDTLGHAVGDVLLRQVADRLGTVIAGERGCRGALTARLGGDEFVVVLPQAQGADAGGLARALIECVGREYAIDGQRVDIGLSIGIALASQGHHDPEQLLRAADMALYRAKGEGRGTYRFFEPEMDTAARARRTLELDLREALETGQLELHYQPLLRLETDCISGFQAVVRWRHPVRGLVAPAEFIPLAEETGLIVALGDWMLREACREATRWPDRFGVSVNLSPIQFRRGSLSLTVVAALGEAGLDPRRLELDVSQGLHLRKEKAPLSMLHELKALGVALAMDDFGTGSSSLGNLRAFPFDTIKIHRSFVADLALRPDAGAIVQAMIRLAADLGMTTTAEGIETPEQLAFLRGQGCTAGRGHLVGPPLRGADLLPLLADDVPFPLLAGDALLPTALHA